MRIAVLPFNAGPDTRPALARQFANFIVEIANAHSSADLDAANYLAQMEENGATRFALVNPSESLNDADMITQFREQSQVENIVDGLLVERAGGGTLTLRHWGESGSEPLATQDFTYLPGGLYEALRGAIGFLAGLSGDKVPDTDDATAFGTADQEAFVHFLQGFDALRFLEQSQGNMVSGFDFEGPISHLTKAIELDKDWEAPFLVLLQYCRASIAFRFGDAQKTEATLKKLTELEPADSRGWFALGEFYEAIGDANGANTAFEKAHQYDPEESAIMHRLARIQLALGMPVNAERNLREAYVKEGDDKPSLDLLSDVLAQTGRGHEVPELWKSVVNENPQNAKARTRFAMSLLATGKRDEGIRAFDEALEQLEDNTFVKRYYAPVLANELDDLDRAMDFYEDCIDVAPADSLLLWEYAQTLGKAGRGFEIPDVLKNLLNTQADPTMKAHANAWLIEIEQPKRAEVVEAAKKRLEEGDAAGAAKDIKPLRNWLGDYWKMWLVLASAHNRLEEPILAEEAARRTLEILPTCEAGYVELNNALSAQNRNDEAFQIMQVAFSNMSGSFPIAISYVMAAHRAGHAEEALRVGTQIKAAMEGSESDAELEPIFKALAEVGVN